MLQHSFVLDALETTGADTFSHFELLIDEHRKLAEESRREGLSATTNGTLTTGTSARINSRLQQLVPTIGVFHTHLPLRAAFEIYNEKHRLTKRKHIQISFNEIRHILNLAQIMAMRKAQPEELSNQYPNPFEASKSRLLVSSHALEDGDGNDSSASSQPSAVGSDDRGIEEVLSPPGQQLNGPQLISFDGDQTLYSDGQNFERNPRLANYLYQLLRHGVYVAVVTAAGYEYKVGLDLWNTSWLNVFRSLTWIYLVHFIGGEIRISLIWSAALFQESRVNRRRMWPLLSLWRRM